MIPYSSRTADKFVVRLTQGMRERISVVAASNHRSMNSEIIKRLEQSLAADGPVGEVDAELINGPELSYQERELLKRYRQLAHRQQQALVTLISGETEPTAAAVPLKLASNG